QEQVFLFGQTGHKPADERGFSAARIRSDYRKELAVCRISESPQGIRHGRRFVKIGNRCVPRKGSVIHLEKCFIHRCHHPSCTGRRRSHPPPAVCSVHVFSPVRKGTGKLPFPVPAWRPAAPEFWSRIPRSLPVLPQKAESPDRIPGSLPETSGRKKSPPCSRSGKVSSHISCPGSLYMPPCLPAGFRGGEMPPPLRRYQGMS